MKTTTFLEMIVAAVLSLAALTVAPALAQDEAEAAPADATAAPGAASAEPPMPTGDPYRAPQALKATCNAEIARDRLWSGTIRADIRREYEDQWQVENANRLTKDNQFVVWAYSVLWVILAAFVVFVFTRQKRLVTEIERLRSDVEAAAAD